MSRRRDGYAPLMARDTFDELSNDDFAAAAGRIRRRKVDAESHEVVDAESEDDEGDDGIDREDGFVLMKDWSYAKWALFLILSLSTALGFIFTMKYLIESVPESWVTPMEPGKHIFTDFTGHRYKVLERKRKQTE